MKNVHCRTWNMAEKKKKYMENETHTLQDL